MRICVQVPGWKRLIHFACWFGTLKSEILKIWKSARILRSLGIWHYFGFMIFYFQVLRTGMQSELTSSSRVLWGSVCKYLDEKGWFTLHADLEHLKVKFRRSEKVPESWDPQESGTTFVFMIFYFQVLRTGIQSELTSSSRALWGSVGRYLDEKGWFTLHVYLEVKYRRSEKVP